MTDILPSAPVQYGFINTSSANSIHIYLFDNLQLTVLTFVRYCSVPGERNKNQKSMDLIELLVLNLNTFFFFLTKERPLLCYNISIVGILLGILNNCNIKICCQYNTIVIATGKFCLNLAVLYVMFGLHKLLIQNIYIFK